MEIRVLGPIEVIDAGNRVDLGGRKQKTVLAMLVANAGKPVSTDRLIDAVYGDEVPSGARRSVQTYVSNLRSKVGDMITSAGSGYEFRPLESTVDIVEFTTRMDAGRAVLATEPADASEELAVALAQWRGHPFQDAEARSELDAETTRFNELRLVALELRVEADLAAGLDRELVGELEALTTEHPLREAFHSQLMLALYRAGRQADALRSYTRMREYLAEDLGIDPSPALRELEQRILEQDPTLSLTPRSAVRRRAILVVDLAAGVGDTLGGPDERRQTLIDLDRVVESSILELGGAVAAQQATATYGTFDDIRSAIAAAEQISTEAPGALDVSIVRIAVDIGDVEEEPTGLISGPAVIRAAGLVAVAHPGQVLLSSDAQTAAAGDTAGGWAMRALGQHSIARLTQPETVHQLIIAQQPSTYPPLLSGVEPPELPTGRVGVPGYELRDELGRGVFGTVYRAYQPAVGREVAVKVINPEFANDPGFIRRFAVEAQMIARIEHPNVVPLHDFWRGPDGALLVMRLMRGGNLADHVGVAGLDREGLLTLVDQVGGALATAHSLGIAHGDVQPSNVLLNESGDFFLGDFGIAGIAPSGQLTQASDTSSFSAMVTDAAALLVLSDAEAALLEGAQRGEFHDAGELLLAWRAEIGAADASPIYTPTRNPYKGLVVFSELDAQDFHGRDAVITELVGAVDTKRLVAAVGPSGVGKSSVVRAGLLPALRDGAITGSVHWLVADCTPGTHPFERLASALVRVASSAPNDLEDMLLASDRGLVKAVDRYLPPGAHLLLLIDQFEELFTLTRSPAEREQFQDLLVASVQDTSGRIRVVVTMRADFFDRPLRHAAFGELLRDGTVPISAPTDTEMRAIITEPAAGVGVSFEAGLVERIVGEVHGEAGALPLVEFALTEMFEQRDTDLLTLSAYEKSGGVIAALGRRAEGIFAGLDAECQDVTRRVFMRLVTPGQDGSDTRRRLRRGELDRIGVRNEALEGVLSAFGKHRLLTFDRDETTRGATVEVAHEALIREWPRLKGWIDGNREELVLRGRLTASVSDWELNDRAEAYLLTGGGLAQHEAWTETTELTLSDSEKELLASSRSAEDERSAKRRRIRQLVMSGFAAAALVAIVLSVFALNARRDADDRRLAAEQAELTAEEQATVAQQERDRAATNAELAEANATAAEQQRRIAEGRALIAGSTAELDDDPDLALLLAVAGADLLDGDVASVAAVREALTATPTIYAGDWPEDQPSRWITGDLSPDGALVAVSGGVGSYFEVRDITTRTTIWSHEFTTDHPEEFEVTLEFFDGGERLLVAVLWVPPRDKEFDPPPEVAGLYTFDVATGEILGEIATDGCGVALLGTESTQPFRSTERSDRFAAVTHFSDSYAGCGTWSAPPLSDVDLVDLETDSLTPLVSDWSAFNGPLSVAVSGDGRFVAYPASTSLDSIGADIVIRDVPSGEIVSTFDVSGPAMGLSHDGSMLAVGTGGSALAIEVHDTATGEVLLELDGHDGEVNDLVFTGADTRLITTGGDALVKIWDLTTGELIRDLIGADTATTELGTSSDDTTVAIFTKGDRWTIASLDPDRLAEGSTLETCQGYDTTFNLRGGVRVAGAADTMAYSFCGETGMILHLWDRETGTTTLHEGLDGQAAAIFPDGSQFVAARMLRNDDGFPYGMAPYSIYDAASGGEIRPLLGICEIDFEEGRGVTPGCDLIPSFPVGALADTLPIEFSAFDLDVSSGGTFVGGATWAGTGMVWDASNGEALAVMQGDTVAFSPDEDRVAFYTSIGGAIQIYDTSSFERIAELRFGSDEHTGQFLVFTPDGAAVVGAGEFGSSDVVIYDGTTLAELGRIEDPHEGGTRDIALNTDGSLIATAGQDGRIRLWDFATLKMVADLPIATERVQAVAFADGDTKIVTATLEGPVVEILLEPAIFLAHARSLLTRGFTTAECLEFFPDGDCPTMDEMLAG